MDCVSNGEAGRGDGGELTGAVRACKTAICPRPRRARGTDCAILRFRCGPWAGPKNTNERLCSASSASVRRSTTCDLLWGSAIPFCCAQCPCRRHCPRNRRNRRDGGSAAIPHVAHRSGEQPLHCASGHSRLQSHRRTIGLTAISAADWSADSRELCIPRGRGTRLSACLRSHSSASPRYTASITGRPAAHSATRAAVWKARAARWR